MAAPQINIYVTRSEREAFNAYARSMGLDVSSLANLLLRRAIQRPEFRGAAVDSDGAKVKITVHDGDGDLRRRLGELADDRSLSLSAMGALVVRRELEEHWLERAINHDDSE